MMSAVIAKDCLAGQVLTPGRTSKAERARRQGKTGGGLAAPMPSVRHRMQEKVRVQFWKTEPCRFYPKCRKGEACPFAHNQDELKFRPNLSKTSLCHDWERGICLLRASECHFAHGYSDMKQTMQNGSGPLKASKIKDPTPLHGEATTASLQAEQIPHNLFGNELDALRREYADMLRSSNLLQQQRQDMERKILKLITGSADAESMLAEPELQTALLLRPPVHSDMMHPQEAAAAQVNSQVRMVTMPVLMPFPAVLAMYPDYLANMLSSAVPDHYED